MNNFEIVNFPLTSNYRNSKKESIICRNLIFTVNENFIKIRNNFEFQKLIDMSPKGNFFEPEAHFTDLVPSLLDFLTENTQIVPLTSKDNSLAHILVNKKLSTENISILETNNNLFNIPSILLKLDELKLDHKEKPQFYILRHILEHFQNPGSFLSNFIKNLNTNDHIYIEIPDVTKNLTEGDFSFFWEEHYNYFTSHSIIKFLISYGFKIDFYYKHSYLLEDCICIVASKNTNITYNESKIQLIINETDRNKKLDFKVILKRLDFLNNILLQKLSNYNIGFFGAGHAALIFIHLLKLNNFTIYDDNPEKIGKYLPNLNIKIKPSSSIKIDCPSIILVTSNPLRNSNVINYINSQYSPPLGLYSIFPNLDISIDNFYNKV